MPVSIPLTAGMELRLRIVNSMFGQVSFNVCRYVVGPTVIPPISVLDALATVAAPIATAYKVLMTNAASHLGVGLTVMFGGIAASPEFRDVTNTGGGSAGTQAQAPQVCGIYTKQTGTGRKLGVGRFFAAFPDAGYVDGGNGQPTAGYKGFLGGMANYLETAIPVTSGPFAAVLLPTVFSRAAAGPPPRPDLNFYVQSVLVRSYFATQRRRSLVRHADGPW